MLFNALLWILIGSSLLVTEWITTVSAAGIPGGKLKPLEKIIKEEIRSGRIPGAVVLVGTPEKVLYRRAFGYRALKPGKLPMSPDTIFDLASLTKVIATTTAVMQLVDNDKIRLDDPVCRYWPEFKSNGKEGITVRDLLTHYSGLKPDLSLQPDWYGYEMALRHIIDEKPLCSRGTRFIYSDINFEVLGELVRRISGKPLDVYCAEYIFEPLSMKDTFFKPPKSLRNRIAPAQYQHGGKGKILCGEVHDPAAYRMGGVAGHAGLFSTADDLSIFARMLLGGGSFEGIRIMNPLSVDKMTLPQSPSDKIPLRGLGWNVGSPFAFNRNELAPVGSYGHKGFTGTFIWIDPVSKMYIIILTNRVHPNGKGNAEPLRGKIMTFVSEALGPVSADRVLEQRPSLTIFRRYVR